MNTYAQAVDCIYSNKRPNDWVIMEVGCVCVWGGGGGGEMVGIEGLFEEGR